MQAAEALRSIATQLRGQTQSRAIQEAVTLSQAVVARASALASAVSPLQPLDATAIGLATPPEYAMKPSPQLHLQLQPGAEDADVSNQHGSAGQDRDPAMHAAADEAIALAEPGGWESWLAAQLDEADETADAALTGSRLGKRDADAPVSTQSERGRAGSHGSAARLRARAERFRLLESHVAAGRSVGRERVATESAAGHRTVMDKTGEHALAELEGVTDGLLGSAGGISSALADGNSRVEAVRAGVRANQRRADACVAELGQSNRSSWMALLHHFGALAAAVVAFVLTYMVIRVMPRGSL